MIVHFFIAFVACSIIAYAKVEIYNKTEFTLGRLKLNQNQTRFICHGIMGGCFALAGSSLRRYHYLPTDIEIVNILIFIASMILIVYSLQWVFKPLLKKYSHG